MRGRNQRAEGTAREKCKKRRGWGSRQDQSKCSYRGHQREGGSNCGEIRSELPKGGWGNGDTERGEDGAGGSIKDREMVILQEGE